MREIRFRFGQTAQVRDWLNSMCGRFDTSRLTWSQIQAQLAAHAPVSTLPLNLEPNPDVRPTTQILTAALQDGAWQVSTRRWGFIPAYAAGKTLDAAQRASTGKLLSTFNARVETVAASGMFRHAYGRRRCLIPADAWYEWTGPKGDKTKHRFRRADGQPLWFAGIYETAHLVDVGELQSCTMLVGPAAGWMRDYHDRAPVVLDPADWTSWFDLDADPRTLLESPRPERFIIS